MRRKFAALEIFWNKRIVSCFDTVLHGQVQAGRSLTAAGHTYQHHVCIFQAFVGLSVVVCQRVVNRINTTVVSFLVTDFMALADGVVTRNTEFTLKRSDEGAGKAR